MAKVHYTNTGIKENRTFSVNIPSVDMARVTDHCGLVSGRNNDKSSLFSCFYGKLKTAPMINECAINMECRLLHTVDLPRYDLFIGEVIDSYVDEKCLTGDIADLAKVNPILFAMTDRGYWKLGDQFARAWDIGKGYKTVT